jgi:hypothetical protein
MDRLTHDELRDLLAQTARACVSIFLPVERAAPALRQNWVRLEHLLQQAEDGLAARGLDKAAARQLLAPVFELIGDQSFWEHQSAGLAIFIAPDLFRLYRLPLAFEELVVVDERMHVTPLLPMLSGDGRFFVLAISLEQARLFECTHYDFRQVALPAMPASLRESLAYDEFARQTQFHSGIPGRGGERGAIFHGQGARDEAMVKEEILRYFQEIDRGLHGVLRDQHAPLILAGLAYLLPIYRAANSYTHLADTGIPCNPDLLSPEELHARGWAIVEPRFAQARQAAAERYRQLAETNPTLASSYLRAIVPAAAAGRVDTLFVAAGQHRWGGYDPGSGVLTLHEAAEPADSDLIDTAAAQAILHGGAVYSLAPEQMPADAPLAAIFRY